MNMWRWFGSLVVMTGLFALVANLPALAQDKGKDDKAKEKVEEKAKDPVPPVNADKDTEKWEWKAFSKKDAKFYQELTTETNQTMKVMGQEVKQEQKQTFYIEWTAEEPKGDDWIVKQKIIGVKMNINIGGNTIAYDSTDAASPANPMTDFFKALTQAELKLTINSKTMEVTKVEGASELIEKLGSTNTQLQPLLKSILSDAALKQMAEPTWGAFPTIAVKKGSTWNKNFNLDLGGIGSYDTKYTYTIESTDPKTGKVKVDAKLDYKAPTDKRNLPFTIKSAKLASTDGTGSAEFDKEKGRIASSEIKMKLEGDLDIEISGTTTAVHLVQDQSSKVKTTDANPIPAPATKK
jgi:Family of unknown function (DUF6263)